MKNKMTKLIAVLLVLMQLMTLFVFNASAEDAADTVAKVTANNIYRVEPEQMVMEK